jgi:hypothetical protein
MSPAVFVEKLAEIVAARRKVAEALPPSPEKERLLKSTMEVCSLSEIKGWLSGELRKPN